MKALADAKGEPTRLWSWFFIVQPADAKMPPTYQALAEIEPVLPGLEQATVTAVAEIDKRIKALYAETEEKLVDLRRQRDKLLAITNESAA
jgi:hypothetical protein